MKNRYLLLIIIFTLTFTFLNKTSSFKSIANAESNGFDCSVVSEIPQTECEALVSIYNSTGGANWNVNTGWLVTSMPCAWVHVVCEDGHVIWLNLLSNNLSGSIPSELSNLTHLDILQLSNNQLTGSIPPEIGDLTNLTRLFILYNQLSGNIPSQIGNLTNLVDLSLVGNQLSGSIPPELGNLINVNYLNLDDNQLSGSLPPEIGNMSSLTQIYVEGNPLEGPIPSTFTNLTLTAFWFENTNICLPDNPEVLNWLSTIGSLHSTGILCVDPSLVINYDSGAPGSYFTITGSDFPDGEVATIYVNGQVLGTTDTSAEGAFTVLFSTTDADEGFYMITATVNPSASTWFTLDVNEPVRPQEGKGTILNVPAGIAFTEFVFLPVIFR
ncbi:MAG: hypothetical protein HUU38_09205 [Anaerolineales bacterium]|nr:hypothetical protein [Anaerolineales bacterium]